VDSALAMFSEMTRMRPDWAFKPDAAIAIDFKKSMIFPQRLPSAVRNRPMLRL
jgi:hypothetical protein